MKSKIEEILKVQNLTKEDDFIKLYFTDLGKIWDLSKPAQQLFGCLIELVEWNPQNSLHNIISLNSSKRKALCKKLKWNEATYNSRLSQGLKELSQYKGDINSQDRILFKLSNDTYFLNPKIASKTNWADTSLLRSLSIQITYEASTSTLITMVEFQSDEQKDILKDILESPMFSPKN